MQDVVCSTRESAAKSVREPSYPKEFGLGAQIIGAFDLLLEANLHRAFDAISNEPIPESLLKLLEGQPARG